MLNFKTAHAQTKRLPEALLRRALAVRGIDPKRVTAEGETYAAALARELVREARAAQ